MSEETYHPQCVKCPHAWTAGRPHYEDGRGYCYMFQHRPDFLETRDCMRRIVTETMTRKPRVTSTDKHYAGGRW